MSRSRISNDTFAVPSKLAGPWLNPLTLLEFREAVENRRPIVILGGRKFLLTYEPGDKVWYQVDRDVTPCGRYPISDILTPGKIITDI